MHNDDAITASLAAPSASLALETFRRVLLPVGGPETDAALVLAAPCLSLLRLGAPRAAPTRSSQAVRASASSPGGACRARAAARTVRRA